MAMLQVQCGGDFIEYEWGKYNTQIWVGEISQEIDGNMLVVTSEMGGGVGQYIKYVGHCWTVNAYYTDPRPTVSSNIDLIDYLSIVKGVMDVNADGIINQLDLTLDGNQIKREFTSSIPYHPDSTYYVRPFVVFNDSIVRYGY